jgi:hypothetical protein
MIKLSDRIISAAIRYQTACSRYQQHEGYHLGLDLACKQAFNELCAAALYADELADIIGQHESGNTIHTDGDNQEGDGI